MFVNSVIRVLYRLKAGLQSKQLLHEYLIS